MGEKKFVGYDLEWAQGQVRNLPLAGEHIAAAIKAIQDHDDCPNPDDSDFLDKALAHMIIAQTKLLPDALMKREGLTKKQLRENMAALVNLRDQINDLLGE